MSIHIITGPMFSAKSKNLIKIAQDLSKTQDLSTFLVIKHALDSRYQPDAGGIYITSHNGERYPAKAYDNLKSIPSDKLLNVKYILIDEAQFFTNLLDFCLDQKLQGKTLYIAGLSKDFMKKPFGQIDELTKYCTTREDLFAICECGGQAIHSFRKKNKLPENKSKEVIVVGGSDIYEPVCDECYDRKSLE